MADIFGDPTPEAESYDDVTLDTLVGEGQKYKNPDELAKAYASADAFIAKKKAREVELEAELKVLRDLVEARKTKEDDSTGKQPDGQRQPDPNPAPKAEDVDLSELVRKEIANRDSETRKAENINKTAEVMTKHYGSPDKANAAIHRRAQELGVSADWLRDAASQSPAAFLASMGVDPNGRSNSTPGFSNEVNLGTSGSQKKDFSYWENLRKTMPSSKFWSSEVQAAMRTARRELGDKFFTT